jgi:ribose transport system substrate-binding protein
MKSWICAAIAVVMLCGCGPKTEPAKDPAPAPVTEQPAPVSEKASEPAADPAGQPAAKLPAADETATKTAPGEAMKVAFVTNNPSDFWKIAQAGTKKAAEELGCEVLFKMPARGTAQEQQQIVQDLLTQNVNGIAISPKDPANQKEMLNDAAAKTILVTQDSDAPESNRACYVGTNNFDAGKAAGELIKQALPEGGKIAIYVGTLDAQNAQDRKRGIEEAIKDSGIEIIDTRTDEIDRAKAMSNAQDTIVSHPDVGCLVGLWSYNGPAILNAVKDTGKLGQIKIVCFDEEAETLQGVKDGHILGTIVQQPYEFGYRSVVTLVALAGGNTAVVPEDKQIYIPVLTIKQDNVDGFWENLKQLTGAQ